MLTEECQHEKSVCCACVTSKRIENQGRDDMEEPIKLMRGFTTEAIAIQQKLRFCLSISLHVIRNETTHTHIRHVGKLNDCCVVGTVVTKASI